MRTIGVIEPHDQRRVRTVVCGRLLVASTMQLLSSLIGSTTNKQLIKKRIFLTEYRIIRAEKGLFSDVDTTSRKKKGQKEPLLAQVVYKN
jgi:hypothetical protein